MKANWYIICGTKKAPGMEQTCISLNFQKTEYWMMVFLVKLSWILFQDFLHLYLLPLSLSIFFGMSLVELPALALCLLLMLMLIIQLDELCLLFHICCRFRRRRRHNVEPGVGKMVSYLNREKKLDSVVGVQPVPPTAPKGLYLYGNVGSGMFLTYSS